jgi:large-conductance mechanosensitive channel
MSTNIDPIVQKQTQKVMYKKRRERLEKELSQQTSSWTLFRKSIKNFVLRNNFITLAMAFAIGQTISLFVTSLTKNIFLPLIYSLVSKDKFLSMRFLLRNNYIEFGQFLTDFIYVLIAIIVIFFTTEYIFNRALAQTETTSVTAEDMVEDAVEKSVEDIPDDFNRMEPKVNTYRKEERPNIQYDRNTAPLNHNLPSHWDNSMITGAY